MTDDRFGDDSYRELLALQDELRRFLSWRDARAATAGLSSGQHQLLLAIRGHRGPSEPTIGDVAEHLSLRHHSAVELVQRAEAAGLLLRRLDETDRRRVRLALSETGRRVLEALEPLHAEELRRLSSGVGTLADGIAHASRLPRERRTAAHPPRHASSRGTRGTRGTGATRGTRGTRGTGGTGGPAPPPAGTGPHVTEVRVVQVADSPGPGVATRVLVDRTWPHGVRAEEAPFDEWLSGVAPSSDLRRWYSDDPGRFDEFRDRYLSELRARGDAGVARLAELCSLGPVVLVTAAGDAQRCAARILADEMSSRPT